MHNDIDEIRNIIIETAREELMPRFRNVKRGLKADGSVITEADLVMQQRISEQLKSRWPSYNFLGEEMDSKQQRALLHAPEPVWCLDPLDGTSNFSIGIPYFSVSLALLQSGRVTHGIVYDPCRDECFHASEGQGASLNGQPLTAEDSGLPLAQASGLVDYKRLPAALVQRLAQNAPYSSQRSFGSVALDWCWVASGRCQVYLHGKQNIWDYAAGNYIFESAGGSSCTLDGEPVFVNELVPRSAVGAQNSRLFESWTQWLGISTSS